MEIDFHKYQGTGNDFIIIDNRTCYFGEKGNKISAKIPELCNRRFGIGADGFILLEKCDGYDFKMIYYNADGKEGTMCGNGGRCAVSFAKLLNVLDKDTKFLAVDGEHSASIEESGEVHLQMRPVLEVEKGRDYFFLNTGSPHHVIMVDDIYNFPVKEKGREISHGSLYGKEGTNVNFVEQQNADTFFVRTYERGVEDETFSCGTGVVASAISMFHFGKTQFQHVNVITKGGRLKVSFKTIEGQYDSIFLGGDAQKVYTGKVYL